LEASVEDKTLVQQYTGMGMLLGTFITFEGCEGSGKTTQADRLVDYLEDLGREVILVREPGGTPVGEKIREILLDSPEDVAISPMTEALLFAADRAQLVKDVIRPALQRGLIVIGDRFVDSSLAYQAVGRGCGLEPIKNLNDWATGNLEPHLTIYLDMAVKDSLARVNEGDMDRIEKETLEFHENVRYAYSMLQRIYSYRYAVVDATGTEEMVHDRVVAEVEKVIM
jgi:dTMP kinase